MSRSRELETVLSSITLSLDSKGRLLLDTCLGDKDAFITAMDEYDPEYDYTHTIAEAIEYHNDMVRNIDAALTKRFGTFMLGAKK
jgi:hypothetical protein